MKQRCRRLRLGSPRGHGGDLAVDLGRGLHRVALQMALEMRAVDQDHLGVLVARAVRVAGLEHAAKVGGDGHPALRVDLVTLLASERRALHLGAFLPVLPAVPPLAGRSPGAARDNGGASRCHSPLRRSLSPSSGPRFTGVTVGGGCHLGGCLLTSAPTLTCDERRLPVCLPLRVFGVFRPISSRSSSWRRDGMGNRGNQLPRWGFLRRSSGCHQWVIPVETSTRRTLVCALPRAAQMW